MIKVDLHTHSVASPDGGLAFEQYQSALTNHWLDCIAITDHNAVDFALDAHTRLGDRIIVGEEITTLEGEIIGLFLTEKVLPGQTLQMAITQIRSQGGLVYVPHPFETIRSGISLEGLNSIVESVDIIETYNGRAILRNHSKQAHAWSLANKKPEAASSDAHGIRGWCRTYTKITGQPTVKNLVQLMRSGNLSTQSVGIQGLLYPKLNRFKKNHAE